MSRLFVLLLLCGCGHSVLQPFVVVGKEYREGGLGVGITTTGSLGYGMTDLSTGRPAIVMGGVRSDEFLLVLEGGHRYSVTEERYLSTCMGDTLWLYCWRTNGGHTVLREEQ